MEYDLSELIHSITVKKRALKITFDFPISLNDTRKLRDYDLKLIITKK